MLGKQAQEIRIRFVQTQSGRPGQWRGRPNKSYKIDDTPLNVARSFIGIHSDEFIRPKT